MLPALWKVKNENSSGKQAPQSQKGFPGNQIPSCHLPVSEEKLANSEAPSSPLLIYLSTWVSSMTSTSMCRGLPQQLADCQAPGIITYQKLHPNQRQNNLQKVRLSVKENTQLLVQNSKNFHLGMMALDCKLST